MRSIVGILRLKTQKRRSIDGVGTPPSDESQRRSPLPVAERPVVGLPRPSTPVTPLSRRPRKAVPLEANVSFVAA